MSYQGKFRVWRGDDSGGSLEDFTVEVNEGEVVLDIIHRLQATQAPDLAVRWNCKAGKCGSCSAEINGRPRLLCMTRMSVFEESETITVTPMRTFPIIRDLVTDVSFNYTKAREVPSFAPPKDLAPGEYRMQQVDVERSQEFRKCIECFLCQNTCHVVRDHEENKEAFSGPRFLMRVAELEMHPLDTADRVDQAQDVRGTRHDAALPVGFDDVERRGVDGAIAGDLDDARREPEPGALARAMVRPLRHHCALGAARPAGLSRRARGLARDRSARVGSRLVSISRDRGAQPNRSRRRHTLRGAARLARVDRSGALAVPRDLLVPPGRG